MLEFQEGFFEQEVRNGFYIDTTMKTVWAAELEMLQKIAEICDRHGLKWYAAYGTLLGAIRHEGFVPWDDDMDIWVKRPDYNKLMKLLPKELPEGYRVRSPLTDEGYEQYHTCVNSGSGVSIAKDWLEQFHGCPFTVGLDIFPLDYMPRDEKERQLQENLLAMAGRIAQLAKNIGRGDYDGEDEESQNQRKNSEEEVREGIAYLEENCKLTLDHQLLEDENWDALSSELWKWGNYIAMMYSEDESDYIVEWLDYIQYGKTRIFPKAWFEDGYSALFEGFMLPIPAEYDNIMRNIYTDYLIYQKKTGMHEYPYYARQLRQLREYVKGVEQRAYDVGIVKIEDIELEDVPTEIPQEWQPYTLKEDGTRKRIFLSANDAVFYARHGQQALDKLEQTLSVFEKAKESVLLWWRPHPVMKKILDEVSPELGARYQRILEGYKTAGWGIYDESDNVDRAVKNCDAYYGDMNAILQPFQDTGKPIMLSTLEPSANNEDRVSEYRTFLSFADYVADGDKLYFANTNYNALVIADKANGKVERTIPFDEVELSARNIHIRCVRKGSKICFLPAAAPFAHIYDMEDDTLLCCRFLSEDEEAFSKKTRRNDWSYFDGTGEVYLLPSSGEQGVWRWNVDDNTFEREEWWDELQICGILYHGSVDEESFYTLERFSRRLWITNVRTRKVERFELPDTNIFAITYGGGNFWYSFGDNMNYIVCWNTVNGVVDRYYIDWTGKKGYACLDNGYYVNGNLYLFSHRDQTLYRFAPDKRELTCVYEFDCIRGQFYSYELEPYIRRVGNELICPMKNGGEIVRVNLDTNEAVREVVSLKLDESAKECTAKLLIASKGVLLEETDEMTLDTFLRFCQES